MSAPSADRPLPSASLLGAAALILSSVLLVSLARQADVGITRLAASTPVATRLLRFEDRTDGSVQVLDTDGATVAVIAPGSNGFLRSVLRGLARERRRSSIDATPPFKLTRWADGRLSLDDPATGRHVDLEVFGPTNAAAFAGLLYGGTAAVAATANPQSASPVVPAARITP